VPQKLDDDPVDWEFILPNNDFYNENWMEYEGSLEEGMAEQIVFCYFP
jgi:hypothetical protein